MNTGGRESRTRLTYSGGVARSRDPKDNTGQTRVSDAEKAGVVDPLTALFMAMRDQPTAGLCKIDQKIFDGKRLTRFDLKTKTVKGDQVICSGLYPAGGRVQTQGSR